MPLRISDEVEQSVRALARDAGRDPDEFATEMLDAAVRCYERKLTTLHEALRLGENSGDAPSGAFNRVRLRLGLPPR